MFKNNKKTKTTYYQKDDSIDSIIQYNFQNSKKIKRIYICITMVVKESILKVIIII
ncbi:DUF2963 domain-containing protein [Candidatus Phytoplasma sp. AldY-WA1]|uniref:DUF2963 domain-containing protein n=1 Tax=Candidatus Phytoplasma sp. AldY-WA1 TaxID=2852100 RepID=UPI00403DADEF